MTALTTTMTVAGAAMTMTTATMMITAVVAAQTTTTPSLMTVPTRGLKPGVRAGHVTMMVSIVSVNAPETVTGIVTVIATAIATGTVTGTETGIVIRATATDPK